MNRKDSIKAIVDKALADPKFAEKLKHQADAYVKSGAQKEKKEFFDNFAIDPDKLQDLDPLDPTNTVIRGTTTTTTITTTVGPATTFTTTTTTTTDTGDDKDDKDNKK